MRAQAARPLVGSASAAAARTSWMPAPQAVPEVAIRTETIRVSGIRCERCVSRLAAALRGLDGLEHANANLMGELTLSWDAARLERETLVAALAKAGFRELPGV